MTQKCNVVRKIESESEMEQDKKMLRQLVQLAADVELFTIPLYMSALYSIAGREVKPDGSVFPWMGQDENYPYQGLDAQKAYNIIYSVYIQEMLHLQLAMNVGNIVGAEMKLAPLPYPFKSKNNPDYDPEKYGPYDPNWIPCLGELHELLKWENNKPDSKKQWDKLPKKIREAITALRKDVNDFEHVSSALGPLDWNSILLFMAIELPDEFSRFDQPGVPLQKDGMDLDPDNFMDVVTFPFGGIGNLYHVIEQYMDFTYEKENGENLFDGKSLFALCYEEAQKKGITQWNAFKEHGTTDNSSYSHMTLELTPGASVTLASGQVKDMINGIVSEGEGSKLSSFDFVSPSYRPDQDDFPADALWSTYSHWARFEAVADELEKAGLCCQLPPFDDSDRDKKIPVVPWTWTAWRDSKANPEKPWTWQELVADPLAYLPILESLGLEKLDGTELANKIAALGPTQQASLAPVELAAERAAAWNDPATKPALNDMLNATYTLFLKTMNAVWSGDTSFPYWGMKAISSRVASVWAAGAVPEFKQAPAPTQKDLHSCQGLNMKPEKPIFSDTTSDLAIGRCDCSTAVEHTCAGTNSCKHEGGCGYPTPKFTTDGYADPLAVPPVNFIPRQNDCKQLGGCGAPMPVAQVFTQQYSANDFGKLNGTGVWDEARKLFLKKLDADPKIDKATKEAAGKNMEKISPIRLILPPS